MLFAYLVVGLAIGFAFGAIFGIRNAQIVFVHQEHPPEAAPKVDE